MTCQFLSFSLAPCASRFPFLRSRAARFRGHTGRGRSRALRRNATEPRTWTWQPRRKRRPCGEPLRRETAPGTTWGILWTCVTPSVRGPAVLVRAGGGREAGARPGGLRGPDCAGVAYRTTPCALVPQRRRCLRGGGWAARGAGSDGRWMARGSGRNRSVAPGGVGLWGRMWHLTRGAWTLEARRWGTEGKRGRREGKRGNKPRQRLERRGRPLPRRLHPGRVVSLLRGGGAGLPSGLTPLPAADRVGRCGDGCRRRRHGQDGR
jgi:hypothetical protein